jgi:hypothetical protein
MKTQAEFQAWALGKLHGIHVVLNSKGTQYTGLEQSAFLNFEMSAAQWGTDIFYQIMQAAQKHWTFLVKEAKRTIYDGRRDEHKIQVAAEDIMVYMLLVLYLFEQGEPDATDLSSRSD